MAGRGFGGSRDALHALALLATAWSLIATSAPDPPVVAARDCFTGVPSPSSLLVTVAASLDADGGAGPSCGAIDGLGPGLALRFDVQQGPRPETVQQECYAFQTSRIGSLSGVSLDAPFTPSDGAFTAASGGFGSTTLQGCRGSWSLELKPPEPVGAEQVTSPLEAGAGSWQLVRTIQLPQAQFCGAGFTTRGEVVCKDAFSVDIVAVGGDP